MSKLKTKKSVAKRFKLTASGKLKIGQANKRHGMRKRSSDQCREARGMTVMHPSDAKRILKHYVPYGFS